MMVAIALGGFVVVALSIVWRRTVGIGESGKVTQLDSRRVQLEGERARVEGEIRDVSTRRHLGGILETRLGMRIPPDNQVVILPRPAQSGNP